MLYSSLNLANHTNKTITEFFFSRTYCSENYLMLVKYMSVFFLPGTLEEGVASNGYFLDSYYLVLFKSS